MRFEVRTTGLVVILLGLAALSTVVFVLGMVAGHQMAIDNAPAHTRLAGVYQAPVPPAAQASPAPSPTSQAIASPAAVASPSAPVASATKAAPAKVASRRHAAIPSTARTAALPPPPVAKPAPTVSRPAVARAAPTHAPVLASEAPAHRAAASPIATPQSVPTEAAAAAPYHKPYNIQIDAVMDRKNADLMVSRMQDLGFHATLVPTDISGKIWWRVRVGPYPTRSEAMAAQVRLRQQYEQAYGRGGIVGGR